VTLGTETGTTNKSANATANSYTWTPTTSTTDVNGLPLAGIPASGSTKLF
jgi:hypothetical protein